MNANTITLNPPDVDRGYRDRMNHRGFNPDETEQWKAGWDQADSQLMAWREEGEC